MSSAVCQHVKNYKDEKGTNTFRVLHAFFVVCVATDSRKIKVSDCYCHICKTRIDRIHACMSCVFFGCHNKKHIHEHAKNSQHHLALDTTFGGVYCYVCRDYMYDDEFEQISLEHQQRAGRHRGIERYFPWQPSGDESAVIKQYDIGKVIRNKSFIGLRGLVNLGKTCFMNCIVQVLTHTPMLRDYFLSEKHICQNEDPSTCLACEMGCLFQAIYSGECFPHIPLRTMYIIWNHAKHLAGYEQQDAHEFFISFLDLLHLHSKDSGVSNSNCSCIVDKIFTGFLQSDVVCNKCNTVSTTFDPFWHISLDIGAGAVSLIDCLVRYTAPEDIFRTCGNCDRYLGSTKQLTIEKLPIVVSFHLKRVNINSKFHKNTTFISFPEVLDMTQFLSTVRGRSANANGAKSHTRFGYNEAKFCLFSVVSHIGKKEQFDGHYISYVRQHSNEWFRCDDEIISKASLEEVLESEGYLLFYHKQTLDYRNTSS